MNIFELVSGYFESRHSIGLGLSVIKLSEVFYEHLLNFLGEKHSSFLVIFINKVGRVEIHVNQYNSPDFEEYLIENLLK